MYVYAYRDTYDDADWDGDLELHLALKAPRPVLENKQGSSPQESMSEPDFSESRTHDALTRPCSATEGISESAAYQ
jgi:hypothetical protein